MWSGVDVEGAGVDEGSGMEDFGGVSEMLVGSGTSIFVRRMGLDPTV